MIHVSSYSVEKTMCVSSNTAKKNDLCKLLHGKEYFTDSFMAVKPKKSTLIKCCDCIVQNYNISNDSILPPKIWAQQIFRRNTCDKWFSENFHSDFNSNHQNPKKYAEKGNFIQFLDKVKVIEYNKYKHLIHSHSFCLLPCVGTYI